MLDYTVSQARKLGMDVDMTLGTGWCFGGPNVPVEQSCIRANATTSRVAGGNAFVLKADRKNVQAVVAYDENGKTIDLTDKLDAGGASPALPGKSLWTVYTVSLRPVRTPVKRAAPGGEGPMLNPFYAAAIRHYLLRFSDAFAMYNGLRPRAVYQDSYEYQSTWSPDLFAEFEKRRGYRLQERLPELFGGADGDKPAGEVRFSRNDLRHDGRKLHAAVGAMGARPRHVDPRPGARLAGQPAGPLRGGRHARNGDVFPRPRTLGLQIRVFGRPRGRAS